MTMGTRNSAASPFRSCLKARSIRKWINSPQRLTPMKRVGKRGSGEFERISWDEALDIIAEKWKYTLDTYGSEAFTIAQPARAATPFSVL